MSHEITILLADDHRIVRQGLKLLIEKQKGMRVIAEAEDGAQAVKVVDEILPDIVIMDVSMPVLNGIEATRRIRDNHPQIRVIALSMHSDRRFVIETLKAGARGYLLKDCAFEEMAGAIRAVMDDKTYLSAEITDLVVKDYVAQLAQNDRSAFAVLTAREREVLQLLAEGRSTKDVAFLLGVSVKTIETYRQQLMEKLGLHSIAELTKYAIREGLTQL